MYTPEHFEERDVTVLHALIRSHPLGAWVIQAEEELVVNTSLFSSTRREVHTARSSAMSRAQIQSGSL